MGIKSISIGGRSDIKKVTMNGGVLFEKAPAPSYEGLCFTAEQAGSTVAMSVNGTPTQGQAFEYSTDGSTWQTFTPGTTVVTLANVGDKMWMRGDNTTVSESNSIYYQFAMTGKIAASGNIMSLLDKTCASIMISASHCFNRLFRGCASLTGCPELPATTIADNCYSAMFYGCTSLTSAPELPASILSQRCYQQMFYGCTSLTSAPELPATTLAMYCYYSMFQDCTSLTLAPALPATELLGDGNYYSMFQGCTSLTSAPALPSQSAIGSCYANMFQGCASLTSAPALPATTLGSNCYSSMFRGCTNLTRVPDLSRGLVDKNGCYSNMFRDCSSLVVYSSSGEGHDKKWTTWNTGGSSVYANIDHMLFGTIGSFSTATSVSAGTAKYTQYEPIV